MNSSAIIIFGVSGDLSKRKLIPALYRLFAQGKLSNSIILGAALEKIDPYDLLERSRPFILDLDEELFQTMRERFFYQSIDFNKHEEFINLHDQLIALEKRFSLPGSRICYLAVASRYFCTITEHVALTGIAQKKEIESKQWHRLVYEKPFGHDLASAHAINDCIAHHFYEHQVYRIDHYLTKEIVSNIALVRFTNAVFEPLWNNHYIDQVQIILDETEGIKERGLYYDSAGALCDVVQNHMLELMALIGMETPQQLTGNFIRSQRAKVLEKIKVIDGLFGQYEGYQQENHVAPHSKTETFVALQLQIDNPRWRGVPFYLKTGKYLAKRETVIHIKFKPATSLLVKDHQSESNWLTLQITPDATFSLSLNAKKPGTNSELIPIAMEFCHSCVFGPQTPEAYEVLFDEIIRGEQSVSVRFDEIEYAWRVIDHVRAQNMNLYSYKKGSTGPDEMENYMHKHDLRWRS